MVDAVKNATVEAAVWLKHVALVSECIVVVMSHDGHLWRPRSSAAIVSTRKLVKSAV